MTISVRHLAIGLVVLILAVSLAAMLWSTRPVDPAVQKWDAPVLQTATPVPSSTPGWWGEMPTPVPLQTATPIPTIPATEESADND